MRVYSTFTIGKHNFSNNNWRNTPPPSFHLPPSSTLWSVALIPFEWDFHNKLNHGPRPNGDTQKRNETDKKIQAKTQGVYTVQWNFTKPYTQTHTKCIHYYLSMLNGNIMNGNHLLEIVFHFRNPMRTVYDLFWILRRIVILVWCEQHLGIVCAKRIEI